MTAPHDPAPATTTGARVYTLSSLYADKGADAPVVFKLVREMIDLPVLASFTIEGEPASKARARWGGRPDRRPYTPEKTRAAENKVGWSFRQAVPGYQPSRTDLFGVVAVFFSEGNRRRDVDNMMKLVLDGLNKVAWQDDAQVTEISARVVRGAEEARTEIAIYRVPPKPRAACTCEKCTAKGEPARCRRGHCSTWRNGRHVCEECAAATAQRYRDRKKTTR